MNGIMNKRDPIIPLPPPKIWKFQVVIWLTTQKQRVKVRAWRDVQPIIFPHSTSQIIVF